MEKRFNPPREELNMLYQQMSMRKIAAHYGVGETVVWKRLKEHGITLDEHGNHRLKKNRVFSEEHLANLRKSRKEKRTFGSANPNWKGGMTDINRRLRTSVEYKEWRVAALELRGNKCQKCGVCDGETCECCGTKVKMHVHHVKSFAKFPESRFDPENSEVLCPKCHYDSHRQ